MELKILVSKKGTKVVTATNLHRALRLPAHKYNSNVAKWLTDIYAFENGVRQAKNLKDFAQRSFQYSKLKDYFISLELAKLITLHSDSSVKQVFAKYLMAMNSDDASLPKTITKKTTIPASPTLFDGGGSLPMGVQLNLWSS